MDTRSEVAGAGGGGAGAGAGGEAGRDGGDGDAVDSSGDHAADAVEAPPEGGADANAAVDSPGDVVSAADVGADVASTADGAADVASTADSSADVVSTPDGGADVNQGDAASDMSPADAHGDANIERNIGPLAFVLSGRYGHGMHALGDIDGDGKLDLVLAGATTNVWRGRGDGTFEATPVATQVKAGSDVPGDRLRVKTANLNGDKYADLFVLEDLPFTAGVPEPSWSRTFYLRGQADAKLNVPNHTDGPGRDGPWGISDVRDVNGDQRDDVLIFGRVKEANADVDLMVFSDTGSLGFLNVTDTRAFYLLVNGSYQVTGVGNIDDDGKPDVALHVVSIQASGQTTVSDYWMKGSGNGKFTHVGAIVPGVLFDGDGDGKADVFNDGTSSVSWNQGGATFSPAASVGGLGRVSGVADFNGDGTLDLWGTRVGDSHIAVQAGTGSRAFGAATGDGPSYPSDPLITVLAADVNGDGATDFVVRRSDVTSVYLSTSLGRR